MGLEIREFKILDYDAAMSLWTSNAGVGLSSADDKDQLEQMLDRNPGLSKVVVDDQRVVGTILCGHDGRRGYLYHLCIDAKHRRRGLASKLVDTCVAELRKMGIQKCHLFVFSGNESGQAFWRNGGWQTRKDIAVFSKDISDSTNGKKP
jgi:ribosomal protein S18 acetylase RimI-like enzyme